MDAYFLLNIVQLFCFVLGRLDGSEFGRHRLYNDSPRKNGLVVFNNVAEKSKIEEIKRINWLVEERYDD